MYTLIQCDRQLGSDVMSTRNRDCCSLFEPGLESRIGSDAYQRAPMFDFLMDDILSRSRNTEV